MNLIGNRKDHEKLLAQSQEGLRQPISTVYNKTGYNTGYYAMGGVLPPVSYKAEGGEIVQHQPQDMPIPYNGKVNPIGNSVTELKGNSHEKGGIDVTGGTNIFSNRLKTDKGTTYAQEAKKLALKLKHAEQLMKNPSFTAQYQSGKMLKKFIELKLQSLFKEQQNKQNYA